MKTDHFTFPKNHSYSFASFLSKKDLPFFCLGIMLFLSVTAFGQWESFSVTEEEPYNAYFTNVFALDSTIWIANASKKIHRTVNNGQSWETYETGVLLASRVYFLDKLRGFVVGNSGEAAKTEDGGVSWTTFEMGTFGFNNLTDIHFTGEIGWVIGDEGTFYQTMDGGTSWTKKSLPSISNYWLNLTDIYFYNDLEGYILGYGYGYFKTIDGGTTWQYRKYRINGIDRTLYLKQIAFKNSLEGWATNERDVFRTLDGGVSWEQIGFWHLIWVKGIYFWNNELGWAIHNDGDISRTMDGGASWEKERINIGLNYALNNITFDDNGNGWAVGNLQLLKKITQPEIQVKNRTTFIANKDTIPDFVDSTDFGTPLETFTRTFTIFNAYTDTLILTNSSPIIITGSSDFKIIQQPTDTIFAGDTTQFTVEYRPSGNGASAKILIENNSLRDSLFEFNVQGNCVACIVEGPNGICDSAENVVYIAPAGMKNYFWEFRNGDGIITGPNNERSVTIAVTNRAVTLDVVFEELNGCRRKCTKEIIVGLSIDEDCSPSMSGVRTVCPNTDSIRYTTPQTFIIGNGVFYDAYYALANKYKWEVISGDAIIVGPDSLFEVFINAGVEDYELQLTIMNYPDCSVTCSELVDVQSPEDLGVCGPEMICSDTEIVYYNAANNMTAYHWKVGNQDSIFYEDSSELSSILVNQLTDDFQVNLSVETDIGCFIQDELSVTVGNDCSFHLNKIIYVNANLTTGLQDGTSWENAFISLQDALDIAVNGDQIWVAKGVYVPTKDKFGNGNPLSSEAVTFYIDKEIQLFGGFEGDELILDERDWEKNETILSGDLNGDDEYINDINNDNFPALNNEENVYSVLHLGGNTSAVIINGFTVKGGNANIDDSDYYVVNDKNAGGGIFLSASDCGLPINPIIKNCTISHNKAIRAGGGLVVLSEGHNVVNPKITNCLFEYNLGTGGAIMSRANVPSNIIIKKCIFRLNRTEGYYKNGGGLFIEIFNNKCMLQISESIIRENSAYRGGGLAIHTYGNYSNSYTEFEDCSIFNNVASQAGGGVYIDFGPGVYAGYTTSKPTGNGNVLFNRTKIHNNLSTNGGGLSSRNYLAESHIELINCLLYKNVARRTGGALYNIITTSSIASSSMRMSHSTIAFNSSGNSASIANQAQTFYPSNYCYISNSIFWGNNGGNISPNPNFRTYVHNSLIDTNYCEAVDWCGEGNVFDVNPLFIDTVLNFRLKYNSPLIDKGNNIIARDTIDLDKRKRIVATINPDTAIIDIGAYEFQNSPILTIDYDSQLIHLPMEYVFTDTFYENESSIYTFQMKNVGNQLLSFTGNPVVQIEGDTNFQLIQQITKNELTLLEEDSFKIQFNAIRRGEYEANIRIPYNSVNNEPYKFKLRIVVLPNEMMSICRSELSLNKEEELINIYYQAEKTIQSNTIIDATKSITFQAGNSITLTPGFHAQKGVNFTAQIQAITCEEALSAATQQRNVIASPKQQYPDVDLTIAPNPFRNSTSIKYNLPKDTEATLQIFSMNGSLIQELVPQQWQAKGNYEYTFEPRTNLGNIYFAVLITEEAVISKKMIVIR